MKLVHRNTTPVTVEKKLPMDKDKAFMAKEKQAFINDHNEKFRKLKQNG